MSSWPHNRIAIIANIQWHDMLQDKCSALQEQMLKASQFRTRKMVWQSPES